MRRISDERDAVLGFPDGDVGGSGNDAEEGSLRCVLVVEEGAEGRVPVRSKFLY